MHKDWGCPIQVNGDFQVTDSIHMHFQGSLKRQF